MNKEGHAISKSPIRTADLGQIADPVASGAENGKIDKLIFDTAHYTARVPDVSVATERLTNITDTDAIRAANEILSARFGFQDSVLEPPSADANPPRQPGPRLLA